MNRSPAFHPLLGLRFPPGYVDPLYDGMSGARVYDDERDGDPREDPARFSEAYRSEDDDWKTKTEAHSKKPQFPGDGQSRTLHTQTGETTRFMQSTMFQEGGVYTVIFDVKYPSGLVFAAVAFIRWSENGNTTQRIIDVVKGTQISIPGRVIDISVVDTTPEALPLIKTDGGGPVDTPDPGTPYTVTALVERGNRAEGSRGPTLYGGTAILASHTTELVEIPVQAGVKELLVTASENAAFPTVEPNILVTFTSAAGGIFLQYSVIDDFVPVPIPPGATHVQISNADASNGAVVGLQWIIDG